MAINAAQTFSFEFRAAAAPHVHTHFLDSVWMPFFLRAGFWNARSMLGCAMPIRRMIKLKRITVTVKRKYRAQYGFSRRLLLSGSSPAVCWQLSRRISSNSLFAEQRPRLLESPRIKMGKMTALVSPRWFVRRKLSISAPIFMWQKWKFGRLSQFYSRPVRLLWSSGLIDAT